MMGRTMGTLFTLQLLMLLLFAAPRHRCVYVEAWGKEGHEIVGNIAYGRLSAEARKAVDAILRVHTSSSKDGDNELSSKGHDDDELNTTPLAAVANWADRVRFTKEYAWSFGLHFVDVRDDEVNGGCPCDAPPPIPNAAVSAVLVADAVATDGAEADDDHEAHEEEEALLLPSSLPSEASSTCRFVYERDCPHDFCAVGAIANYTHRLVKAYNNERDAHARNRARSDGPSQREARTLRGSRVEPAAAVDNDHGDDGNDKNDGWPAREALMFLTHFVGDLHQPLHSSRASDKGGNTIHVSFDGSLDGSRDEYYAAPPPRVYGYYARAPVQAAGDGRVDGLTDSARLLVRGRSAGERINDHHKGWNLHSVWDDAIIDRAIAHQYNHSQLAFQSAVFDLIDQAEHTGLIDVWLRCYDGANLDCPSAWAEESLDDALRWAYADEYGNEIGDGAVLSEAYMESRIHVVQRRLAAAGVRLAATLEAALGGSRGEEEWRDWE